MACVPVPPNSTAAWNQSVSPVPISAPAPSSCRSYFANETMPASTAKTSEPTSSKAWSTK